MLMTIRVAAVVLWVLPAAWAATSSAAEAPPPLPSAAASAPTPGVSPAPSTPTADATRAPSATLRILNRDVLVMRGSLAGATPAERVRRARERLDDLHADAIDAPLRVLPFNLGGDIGVQLLLGDRLLFSVLRDDVDAEARQSFDALVRDTQARVEDVRQAWHATRDTPLMLRGLLRTAIATVVLALAIWIVYRLGRRAVVWLEAQRDVLAARHTDVDWREFFARFALTLVQLAQWFLLLVLAYLWLRSVLESFVATLPLAHRLGDWLWGKLSWVADGVIESLPGLATIVLVLLITRALVDVLGYFFNAIQQGRLRLPTLHPETTGATRRIVTMIAWGLGLAVAYPYLPGSHSDAFKGLSVLFGVMITLGSTGLVTQAMSGLVVIYSRALRKGDFVDVNGVQGVVTEVASLATKVVNVRNEEVTIPNSVLIASPIRNYSKLAGTQGTLLTTRMTIGYDTPWRQVHELLIGAAQRTEGVRAAPVPYVYQSALSDFYVEYELYVAIDRPLDRVPILSRLHASIQDAFNAAGVQIMSPHFFEQPAQPVVVPKDRWFARSADAAELPRRP